jgi:hypothetical protein
MRWEDDEGERTKKVGPEDTTVGLMSTAVQDELAYCQHE